VLRLRNPFSVRSPVAYGSCERLLDSPSVIESIQQQVWLESIFPSPCRNSLGFAKMRDKFVSRVFRIRGECQRFFNRPTHLEAVHDDIWINSVLSRPFASALSLAVVRDEMRSACVAILLVLRLPSHVARKVSQFIINTTYGVFSSWSVSNVSKKLREGVPFWTYRDSPSSVEVVEVTGRTVAPPTHCTPCAILGGASLACESC
jgi:hypothetical protein